MKIFNFQEGVSLIGGAIFGQIAPAAKICAILNLKMLKILPATLFYVSLCPSDNGACTIIRIIRNFFVDFLMFFSLVYWCMHQYFRILVHAPLYGVHHNAREKGKFQNFLQP